MKYLKSATIAANYLSDLRFKALVELLLGTGMRIGEALSLNRDQIDFERAKAKIIGKGGKARTVFFTDRALFWIEHYLEARRDNLRRYSFAKMDRQGLNALIFGGLLPGSAAFPALRKG